MDDRLAPAHYCFPVDGAPASPRDAERHPLMPVALVTPGDALHPSSTHAPGPGTHVRASDGAICASLVGTPVVEDVDGQVKRIFDGWHDSETTRAQA